MMLFKPMIKRISANTKSKHNHSNFKPSVMNNVYTKQRNTAQKQWQQRTMNGAGQRSSNT